MPAKVYFLAVLGLVFVGAMIALPVVLSHMKHSAQAIAKVPEKRGAAATRDASLRQTDYAKWLTPRIAGMPWTAPAYDQLQVRANPRVFCIAVEDGSTHCVTEQGTDLDVPPAVARQIAAHGVYDPFLDPQRDRADTGQERRGREQQPQSMAPQAPAAAAPAPPPSSGAVGALADSTLMWPSVTLKTGHPERLQTSHRNRSQIGRIVHVSDFMCEILQKTNNCDANTIPAGYEIKLPGTHAKPAGQGRQHGSVTEPQLVAPMSVYTAVFAC